jgi:hypothetical protein
MTATIAPAGWPANQPPESAEERKDYIKQQITLWVGNLRLDAALKAEELGQYSGLQKALLLRNGLLVGSIRHCRLNPRADTRMPILTLITFLADNNDGICWLSVSRMCEIFKRSRQAIVDGIDSLEKDGLIGCIYKKGLASCYWPMIPAALAELSADPKWFVDTLSTKPKYRMFGSPEAAIEAATAAQDGSTLPDQSTSLDHSTSLDRHRSGELDHHRSTTVDHQDDAGQVDLTATGQVQPNRISDSSFSSVGDSSLSFGDVSAPPPPERAKRGKRLTADWRLPQSWGQWALTEFGVSEQAVRREADTFRDYWCGRADKGAVKLDWEATWRNWCRKAFQGGAAHAPRPSNYRSTSI